MSKHYLPGSPKLDQQDSWVLSRGFGIALLLGPLGIASPTSGNAEIFIFEYHHYNLFECAITFKVIGRETKNKVFVYAAKCLPQ